MRYEVRDLLEALKQAQQTVNDLSHKLREIQVACKHPTVVIECRPHLSYNRCLDCEAISTRRVSLCCTPWNCEHPPDPEPEIVEEEQDNASE